MRGHFTTQKNQGTAMYQPYPNQPTQKPRRPRWIWIVPLIGALTIGATLGIVFALTGGGNTPAPPPAVKMFMMSGSITIKSDGRGITSDSGGTCYGRGGYSDLAPGTAVTVADPQGHIIATGSLRPGKLLTVTTGCQLSFLVGPLPQGLASYSVTVSHRGTQVIQPEEAQDEVQLTIGGN
ncbi:MAG: hypothetical protein AUG44_08710 [Actinobacteria bacterium 13_1_20CM_3_71_11]|nr:MAG: hypothetical protein AUG44_08710 [Actinobacteria bacterium 13_1_20CM_3_71_11]